MVLTQIIYSMNSSRKRSQRGLSVETPAAPGPLVLECRLNGGGTNPSASLAGRGPRAPFSLTSN